MHAASESILILAAIARSPIGVRLKMSLGEPCLDGSLTVAILADSWMRRGMCSAHSLIASLCCRGTAGA